MFCILSGFLMAQSLPEAEKQQVLQTLQFNGFLKMLDGKPWLNVSIALVKVGEYKIREAIPIIESKIWWGDDFLVDHMLRVLDSLQDPNLESVAITIVDTAGAIIAGAPRKDECYFSNPQGIRNLAIYYLFKLGNFNFADLYIQYIKDKGGLSSYYDIDMAGMLGKAMPTHRELMKQELLKVMYSSSYFRGYVSSVIWYSFGQDALLELTDNFTATDDSSGTNAVLAMHISSLQYTPFESALKLKLSSSRELWHHDDYLKSLLKNYGSPVNYQFVSSYANTQQNEMKKNEAEYLLYTFIPDAPSINTPINVLLDTLFSHTLQCQMFNWLGHQNFVTELLSYITNARNFLNAGNQIVCARYIQIFQTHIDQENGDSTQPNNKFVTKDGWKFLHYDAHYILDRLPQIPPDPIIINIAPANIIANSNPFTLTVTGKNFVSGSIVYWNNQPKTTTFIADTILQSSILAGDIAVVDSPFVTIKNPDGGESNGVRFYIKPQPQVTGCVVKLVNSSGARLTSGTLQYYEGNWKDAVNNNDGTFTITTNQKTLSLRMTYENGTQTKSNVPVGTDTIVFQTVNAQIQLQNSNGALIDTGTVQYYAGAWRSLGTTTNGIAVKELLPNTYSFRMSYAYASKDKQQDIGTNPTVIFQTVNAAVQLKNSQGSLTDQGTVQYYSGAWRNFGTTANGVTTKELLPNNYSFRMTYAYASKDKQQDIGTNNIVVFQTVNATVQLQNSQGSLIDQGTIQYYSGAWRDFGNTTNGTAIKELLPNNYSFRMTHEYISMDKSQDISTNNAVSFSTVLCTVRVKNSQNQPVDNAQASYYSGAWRQIGNTVNGEVTKELLPVNLTFRVKSGTVQQDKAQNLSTNNVVEFVLQP